MENKLVKDADVIVVGVGVVGLAIAKKIAELGLHTLMLEANSEIGRESSFRNSAVIHAGIYYPKNSLKERFCKIGRDALYDYAKQHNVPHKRCGKLIVATDTAQLKKLTELQQQAKQNGVTELEYLSAADVAAIEPQVRCVGALYSPATGIIHGQTLLQTYLADAKRYGAELVLDCPVTSGQAQDHQFVIYSDKQDCYYKSRFLINAAGLWAPQVAKSIAGIPAASIPTAYFAKGNYFKYDGESPFTRLVYPVPETAGLGIHATVDLANQLRFGPDVEWVNELDYSVSMDKRTAFFKAISAYFPTIREEQLVPEFAGIRPKIAPANEQPQDFLIQTEKEHGVKGLINLYGIESPGLTASLAVGDYVHDFIKISRKPAI